VWFIEGMTLTKHDLQAIGTLVDERLDTKLEPVKKDLATVKKDVKVIKKDVKQIRTDINSTLGYIDKQDKSLGVRITKVEQHLNLV